MVKDRKDCNGRWNDHGMFLNVHHTQWWATTTSGCVTGTNMSAHTVRACLPSSERRHQTERTWGKKERSLNHNN